MSYLDNIRTFVRVYELGSMSAAGRDLRISPAVTSSRISQLEEHLSVRLFQRTTRSLTPTAQGQAFYTGACSVLEAVDHAEAQVTDLTDNPKGQLHVAAPLGVGRRLIAPHVPEFASQYPLVDVRLRLTDRNVDLPKEGLDVAFFLGQPEDSNLRIRAIADCQRVVCASPTYLSQRGSPANGQDLVDGKFIRFAKQFHCRMHVSKADLVNFEIWVPLKSGESLFYLLVVYFDTFCMYLFYSETTKHTGSEKHAIW